MEQISGRAIDKETLMAAIKELNDKLETRFKGLEEVEVFTAKDPQTHDYFKWRGAKIFCEDSRLSLASPGQSFKGINLNTIRDPPVELTLDEVEFLVDTIAATLDIESVETRPKTATHKLKWDILESQHFFFASTLCIQPHDPRDPASRSTSAGCMRSERPALAMQVAIRELVDHKRQAAPSGPPVLVLICPSQIL